TLGARVDKFSVIDHAVVSPRLAVLYKATRDHALRLSFNRAFRSPSVINNSLFIKRLYPVDLSLLGLPQPFPLVTELRGNPNLKEESLSAFEASYAGTFGGPRVSAAASLNTLYAPIPFTTEPFSREPYTSSNPPPNWPFPPAVLDVLAASGVF